MNDPEIEAFDLRREVTRLRAENERLRASMWEAASDLDEVAGRLRAALQEGEPDPDAARKGES